MKKEAKKINVIPISKELKNRLIQILDQVKGKDLFPEKTALAQKTLENVKLPI
jgi:hypothetical protein